MISFGRTSLRLRLERVVVDPLVVLADAVAVDLEVAAAEVEGHPMGEVAAVGEASCPRTRSPGLTVAQVGGHVGLGARSGAGH